MKTWPKNLSLLCVLLAHFSIMAVGQERQSANIDNSIVEIPAVTKSSPRLVTMADLLAIRDCEGLSISPDGEEVAFVVGRAVYETNDYRTGLFVSSTKPNSAAVDLGTAGLPHWDEINQWISEAPQWSPDSRFITYRMKRSADHSWQVWRWDRNGGPPVQLSHVPGDVTSYHWTGDGAHLVLTVQRNQDQEEAERLSERGIVYDGEIRPWTGLPIVSQVLAHQERPTKTWIYDFATSRERVASRQENDLFGARIADLEAEVSRGKPGSSQGCHINEAKKSPDGRWVAFRCKVDDADKVKPFEVDLFVKPVQGGEPIKLAPLSSGSLVDQFWWSQNGKEIYFSQFAQDGHAAILMVVNENGWKSRLLFREPNQDFCGSFSVDEDGKYGACVSDNNTTPPRIGLMDLTAGTVRTLVDLNPEFKNIELGQVSRLEGTNSYGATWFAHVVKPIGYESGKRYPLIVTTYRSGDYFLRGASGNENPIQVYAANGFVVLSFDVGFDPNFRPGDFQTKLQTWASPTASIEMAVRQLVDQGLVDAQRVGISGYSHGVEIVGYALTHTNLFRAASGAGGYDPYIYYMGGIVWQNIFATWGLGGWPEGSARVKWEELSPTLRADRIHAAILNNVPETEYIPFLDLCVSLEQLGKPVEMVVYPNELHVINQPKHRYEIYQRNLDWFRFWLKGEEDSDTNKRDQYTRWRSLRERH